MNYSKLYGKDTNQPGKCPTHQNGYQLDVPFIVAFEIKLDKKKKNPLQTLNPINNTTLDKATQIDENTYSQVPLDCKAKGKKKHKLIPYSIKIIINNREILFPSLVTCSLAKE